MFECPRLLWVAHMAVFWTPGLLTVDYILTCGYMVLLRQICSNSLKKWDTSPNILFCEEGRAQGHLLVGAQGLVSGQVLMSGLHLRA